MNKPEPLKGRCPNFTSEHVFFLDDIIKLNNYKPRLVRVSRCNDNEFKLVVEHEWEDEGK